MSTVERIAYSYADAAAATGLSESTLRRAVAADDLAVHWIGAKPVIHVTELNDWILSKPSEPPKKT